MKNSVITCQALRELVSILQSMGKETISPTVISLAATFLPTLDKTYFIEEFIRKSEPVWDKIYDKDESFFVENAVSIFDHFPSDKVASLKKLFVVASEVDSPAVEDIKQQLWALFGAMVKICIKYIARKRKTGSFEEVIDLSRHVHKWGVKL